MEWKEIAGAVQNFGAIIIIALMVYKSPAIIQQLSEMIQKVISNVRETQTEALKVFKEEQDKVLTLMNDRFTAVENNLLQNVKAQSESLTELKNLATELKGLAGEVSKVSNRVEDLERDKSR